MNTLVKALVLSVSTALVAAPVFAAPQDHQPNQHQPAPHTQKAPAPTQMKHDNKQPQPAAKNQQNQKSVKPSRDWRVGNKVPKQFQAKQYKVDHKVDKRLSKPAKNQQWMKVNGDYVLTNGPEFVIIKIMKS